MSGMVTSEKSEKALVEGVIPISRYHVAGARNLEDLGLRDQLSHLGNAVVVHNIALATADQKRR